MPIDYNYEHSGDALETPTGPGPTIPKVQEPPAPDPTACYSTTLQQLDQIELLNRNQDTLNQTTVPQSFPDPLKGNMFMATVPDGGILTQKPIKKPVVYSDIRAEPDKWKGVDENTRLQILNDQANQPAPPSQGMSLADFIKSIAQAYLDIINDLLDARSLDDLHNIFLKDNRILPIGILFIAVAVFFLFFSGKTDALSSDSLVDVIKI